MDTVRPLRVWHLGKYYPPATGGMETHIQTLARAQAALGAQVTVVCMNHARRSGEDVTWRRLPRSPTVEDQDGPVRVLRLGRLASVAKLDLCPALIGALRVGREGADVLHLHVPNPTMMIGLVAARMHRRLVVTWHSDVVLQRFRAAVFRPVERAVLDAAARIVCSSPAYPAGSDALRPYREKITILPFGIDLARFIERAPAARAAEERLRLEHGEPLWLAVGRLVYYKGFANAIDALADVPGKLLVVGTGPLEGELRRRAEASGVAGRVAWLGQLSDEVLAGALFAATALWFPSNARSEAFGLAQLEAMASGCPVINTLIPHSGVPWVSRDGESGLTVPVDDPRALAAAARRLLEEPGLRARLAEGGRARVRAEFDQAVMAQRTLALYAEACGAHQVAAAGALAV